MTHSTGFFTSIRARFERNRLGELLVRKGKITPTQLHHALKTQKQTNKTIGAVLSDELGYVTQFDIRASLFEQASYRAIAAGFAFFIGVMSFTPRTAQAGGLTPYQQSMVHKASYNRLPSDTIIAPKSYPKLFGTSEIESKDISAFKKWTGILKKLNKVSFNAQQMNKFKNLSLDEKITAVNQLANNVRYIEDKNNFGQSDYWATPAEFFARGGDCEDYAIAKYAMLKDLGVPESQMRIAIVQDQIKRIPHAILIVYTDNGAKILDNQLKTAVPDTKVSHYKPLYSINANGWWRHMAS